MTILLGAGPSEFEAFIASGRAVDDVVEHATAIAWVFDRAAEQILLLRHRIHGWSCPGGHLEPGETPYDAAVRELMEETGISATPLSVEPVVVSRRLGCPRAPHDVVYHWTFGFEFGLSSAITPTTEPDQPGRWWPLSTLPRPRPGDIDEVLSALGLPT